MLPNAPSSASDMLSDMTASFIASQQVGNKIKEREIELKRAEAKEGTKK